MADSKNVVRVFLTKFFARLNEEEIPFCVLRNYFSLPDFVEGTDIDILVGAHFVNTVRNVIEHASLSLGWSVLSVYPKHYRILHFRIAYFNSESFDTVFLRLDIMTDVGVLMWCLIPGEHVLKKRMPYENKNFHIPDPGTEAAITVVQGLLSFGSRLKSRYFAFLREIASQPGTGFFPHLTRVWGKKKACWVRKQIQDGTFDSLYAHRMDLRYQAFSRCCLAHPLMQVKDFFATVKLFFCRIVSPPGKWIVFLGPDGIGKSSLITYLSERLKKVYPEVKTFHLRPRILPDIKDILRRRPSDLSQELEWERRSRNKPGFAGSLVRVCYVMVDYILGFWVRFFPLLVQGRLVLVDRYFYDYFVDPFSKNAHLPRWLLKIFLFMVPKPDKVICLIDTAERISDRKKEIPITEIKRQLEALKELSDWEKRCRIVHVRKTVEETGESLIHDIWASEKKPLLVGNTYQ